jgi:uncharacterized protein Smg (DUF494 family)
MRIDTKSSGATNGRILEIITLLLAEMGGRRELADVDTRKLYDKGYSDVEVSTAVTWLMDKLALSSMQVQLFQSGPKYNPNLPPRDQFRTFHEVEQSMFSVDSQGYLLQLRELGLLSDGELEMIIDRVWFFGGQNIALESLREIAAQVIFDFNDSTRSHSRMMLGTHDTIH